MSTPAKFLFDLDFAAPKAANAVALADHQIKVGEAETRGYRNGFEAAQQEAAADTARRLAFALDRIAQSVEDLTRGLHVVERRLEAEAVEVAVATARKLAGTLVVREPFAEIAALVTNCFRQLTATPHVVVRVNDALYGDAQIKLEDIARRVGFEGRLVVLAEPDIGDGDCRIEWADGGIKRDTAAAERIIEDTVKRFISGLGVETAHPVKGEEI